MIDFNAYAQRKKTVEVFMRANNFEKALELLNKWIDDGMARNGYFDDDEVYWLRLLAKNGVKTDDELIALGIDISEDVNYCFAMEYSSEEFRNKRVSVMERARENFELKRTEERRNKAKEEELRLADEKRKIEEERAKKLLEINLKKEEEDRKRAEEKIKADERKKRITININAKIFKYAIELLDKWIDEIAQKKGYCDEDELYWLRLQAKNGVKTDEELIELGLDISEDVDYLFAMEYSSDDVKKKRRLVMERAKATKVRRIEEERRSAIEKRELEEKERKRLAEAKREEEERRRIEALKPKKNGSYVYFGTYPQTKVSDGATIAELNSLAGVFPTAGNPKSWTSYGYYVLGKKRDFMWYKDVEFKGERFRGVYFTEYRPDACNCDTWINIMQKNGYELSNVYWFKFEPVKWRILGESNDKAIILSEKILDSQPFDFDGSIDSHYADSTVRTWLNKDFYETAFNSFQNNYIQITTVDNSVASTGRVENLYASKNTFDRIFLLSHAEARNSSYGFSSNAARQKKSSDYAKVQGCRIHEYNNGSSWWLRSPDKDREHAWYVLVDGSLIYVTNVCSTDLGIAPAMVIRLS